MLSDTQVTLDLGIYNKITHESHLNKGLIGSGAHSMPSAGHWTWGGGGPNHSETSTRVNLAGDIRHVRC